MIRLTKFITVLFAGSLLLSACHWESDGFEFPEIPSRGAEPDVPPASVDDPDTSGEAEPPAEDDPVEQVDDEPADETDDEDSNEPASGVGSPLRYQGVNLAGADFGEGDLPGVFGTHYTYPTTDEIDYFTAKGMNIFRLPFRWERLQPAENGPLDAEELARIRAVVDYAAAVDATVILDPHNYARYYGEVIGSPELPITSFGDFWTKLAAEFQADELVIFGLMNEPAEMDTELWLADANAAIAAIRSTGAGNLILVPGNAYTGAHSWNADWYGTPNGEVMDGVVDPVNNYVFELHQYLDSDSSGTSTECVSDTIGSERLVDVTDWLRDHNQQGFLGEFASSVDTTCLTAMDDMLDFMDDNADVWMGWSYWAAGPWWGDDIYTIEPDALGEDRAQMDKLELQLTAP